MTTQPAAVDAKAKTCFVMMPLGPNVGGYPAPNHFAEVFEHLIKPACEAAGYKPAMANDNQATEVIMGRVLNNIVAADIVLCDMSSRNANVFYELGLRQAFGKPVVLVIDDRSQEPFDVQGLRYTRYRSALRITEISSDVQNIADSITATAQGDGANNLMQLIGMQAAKLPTDTKAAPETIAILSALQDISARFSSLESRINAVGFGDHLYGTAAFGGTGATGFRGGLLTPAKSHVDYTPPNLALLDAEKMKK